MSCLTFGYHCMFLSRRKKPLQLLCCGTGSEKWNSEKMLINRKLIKEGNPNPGIPWRLTHNKLLKLKVLLTSSSLENYGSEQWTWAPASSWRPSVVAHLILSLSPSYCVQVLKHLSLFCHLQGIVKHSISTTTSHTSSSSTSSTYLDSWTTFNTCHWENNYHTEIVSQAVHWHNISTWTWPTILVVSDVHLTSQLWTSWWHYSLMAQNLKFTATHCPFNSLRSMLSISTEKEVLHATTSSLLVPMHVFHNHPSLSLVVDPVWLHTACGNNFKLNTSAAVLRRTYQCNLLK